MAYPVFKDFTSYTTDTQVTTHTINFPTTTKNGDKLWFVAKISGTAGAPYTSNTGGFGTTVQNNRFLILGKTADGTEGGTTFTITFSSNFEICGGIFRYAGAGSMSVGSETAGEDPGAVTLADTRDWEFISIAGTRRTDNSYTAQPSGYDSVTQYANAVSSADTADQRFAYARKATNKGTSEDPGTWTTSGTLSNSRSMALAIQGCLATLSSPTSTSVGSSTATARVTSDYSTSGTIYCVVTTNSTEPTAYQIKNGLNASGTAATWSGSDNTPTAGTNDFSATGLASSQLYYMFFVQEVGGIDSNIVSNSFTTTSSGRTVTPVASSGTPGSTVVVNLTGYSGTPTSVTFKSVACSFTGNSSSITVTLPALSTFVNGGTHEATRWDTNYVLQVNESGGNATANFQIDPPDTDGPTYWFYAAAAGPYPGDTIHPTVTASGDDVFVEVTAGTVSAIDTSGSPSFTAIPAILKVRIFDASVPKWSSVTSWTFSDTVSLGSSVRGVGTGHVGKLGAA